MGAVPMVFFSSNVSFNKFTDPLTNKTDNLSLFDTNYTTRCHTRQQKYGIQYIIKMHYNECRPAEQGKINLSNGD